ncbi:phosphomannomutase [Tersicoccus solisilvae]|uniref:Phosphomannomutase n=1 Tax=Tersicoccus solisilvae TaxID=1882339 RepID=A0ABQ1PN23_9MICC|nr:phospho-sugar mutase [Tersicoccus solisilvae]GGC99952.1 phosphomannomutase [Tersicoccus solisilvae]
MSQQRTPSSPPPSPTETTGAVPTTATAGGPTALAEAARAWADADPDPRTRAELLADLDAVTAGDDDARERLADAFAGPLTFGTAGLRAALGAGPNRMNRLVVRQAAAGLARYLLDVSAGAYRPRAVIGFDARHNSDVFAADTAAVLTAAGVESLLMPAALPTPVLAWAVRRFDAEAGVMVTASHNPPQDNGYKVYLGGRASDDDGRGAQIVSPVDAAIAERIRAVDATDPAAVPLAADGWTVLDAAVADEYRAGVTALARPDTFDARDLAIVLTPMHGVGGSTMTRVLTDAGFGDVHLVAEQAAPDPAFPTVAFPNPEEPGALDLALAAARERGADLIIANDPDADRVALAVAHDGDYRVLTGDETGALLGAHVLDRERRAAAEDQAGAGTGAGGLGSRRPVFANSVVSSRLLARIARQAGVEHRVTLTGFKWITRTPGLTFGYEEALGYCVDPAAVRDKDGISAGLLAAELAADAKAEGRTLVDVLDDLHLLHGVHRTRQLSVRVSDLGLLDAMMHHLRESGPTAFDGSAVVVAVDLAAGEAVPGLPALPPTEGLYWVTEAGNRVIVRPSGTEPKLKCYLEAVVPAASRAELPEATARADATLDAIATDLRELLDLSPRED